ncbi:4354_t:CDS:2 [Funneliformis geosporum]|uniref:4354_t:CDS:1 n=1 Tax=Funneliformis geosporum TaxID=1117311 RepID=A0A9W4WM24_9GLOM|nr:4354_t:CDS:2 [Funneliformis geosporum]
MWDTIVIILTNHDYNEGKGYLYPCGVGYNTSNLSAKLSDA